jgi:hypothetical protein
VDRLDREQPLRLLKADGTLVLAPNERDLALRPFQGALDGASVGDLDLCTPVGVGGRPQG